MMNTTKRPGLDQQPYQEGVAAMHRKELIEIELARLRQARMGDHLGVLDVRPAAGQAVNFGIVQSAPFFRQASTLWPAPNARNIFQRMDRLHSSR
jgi:hypothetical protein